MDMKETSAMTEASGLTNEQDGIEQTSDARRRPLESLRRMPRSAGLSGCAT